MRFPRRTFTDSVSMADTSRAYVDHARYAIFAPPATSVSPVAALSHVTNSSNLEAAFTSGNSEADHMLEKLPEKYTSVDSLALATHDEIAPLECLETPQIRNAKSVEADLVRERFSLSEAQVFDEISQTAVSSCITEHKDRFCEDVSLQTNVPTAVTDDTKGSHSVEEENSQDDVALLDNNPQRDASAFLVPFAKQGTMMSNACSRLTEIENPFADTFWFCTIPSWHNSLEEFRGGNQNGMPLCLGFLLRKCNWVDTGQECTLPGFLLFGIGAHRNCDGLALSRESVILSGWIAGSRMVSFGALLPSTPVVMSDKANNGALISKRIVVSFQKKEIVDALCLDNFFLTNEVSIPTRELHYVELYLEAEHGKPTGRFSDQLILIRYPFDPGAKFVTVPIRLTATTLCVWNPRISFTFTVNVDVLQLQRYSAKFFLIAYLNSMTKVWDPGQPWCLNSSISQSDSTLTVALSPNFGHFYIVERDLSLYLKALAPKVNGLTWSRKNLVLLLAWLDKK